MTTNRKPSLIMSPAPHIHSGTSISSAMIMYFIAMVPLIIFGIYSYGWHAVRVISLCVSSAVIWELLIQALFKRRIGINDGTAFITGLIFALMLPASAPWWLIIIGTLIAMLVGKHIFGGNGTNPFNPVLIAWAALDLSWKDYLDYGVALVNYDINFPIEYPLSVLKKAGATGLVDVFKIDLQNIWTAKLNLFMGHQVGGLGTTAGFLIVIGGLFLILRGVISWRVPLFYLIGIFLTSLIFWLVNPGSYADPVFHLVSGRALFGVFFLATDYSSSPSNKTAMIIFGLGCGLFTVIFRTWSIYHAVPFAILMMNIINPLLDKIRPGVPGKNVTIMKVVS